MNDNNLETWKEDDIEEDYEEEEVVKREDPLPELDTSFRENIKNVKHSLYNNIVLSPELGTDGVQDNTVLETYLEKLNKLYILSISAENGKRIPDKALVIFPESSRPLIRATLDWIVDFFRKNHISLTVPYSDHIRKSFHDYQFVQNNSFDDE
jgi:hypothetical protein